MSAILFARLSESSSCLGVKKADARDVAPIPVAILPAVPIVKALSARPVAPKLLNTFGKILPKPKPVPAAFPYFIVGKNLAKGPILPPPK